MTDRAPKSLYVHVPFCEGKCRYCDFYSVVPSPGAIGRYLDALRVEIDLVQPQASGTFETVYIGGGTPTVLAEAELAELLAVVRDAFEIATDAEVTVEANPGTLSVAKLRVLKDCRVNRLSIGAQSFEDRLLRILGRRHRAGEITDALEAARAEGLTNLSLDLIFGVPTQTVADWMHDLEKLLTCDVPHVSTYSLTYEKGTPLADALERGELTRVDEEDDLRMYETVIDTLAANGYDHYEISNFARPGFACRHNEVYWANASYLGLGPSAVSYLDGERRRNVASVEAYAERLGTGALPVDFAERLDAERRARETVVMNLRRTRGINVAAFRRHTGFDVLRLVARELEVLSRQELVAVDEETICLTRRGRMVADTVLSELV